jgi:hypothetical protein
MHSKIVDGNCSVSLYVSHLYTVRRYLYVTGQIGGSPSTVISPVTCYIPGIFPSTRSLRACSSIRV